MMTRLRILVGFVAVLLLATSVGGVSAAKLISKTLRLGDVHPDVRTLQQVLNRSVDTQVATIGPGSPGAETTSFGPKTRDAVSRFQSKYQADILQPAGLSKPTGVVGQRTLQKINTLLAQDGASAPVSVGTSTMAPPVAYTPSPNTAPRSITSFTRAEVLEAYVAKIHSLGVQQGYASTTLALIEEKIRKDDAGAEYTQKFYEDERARYVREHPQTSTLNKFFTSTFASIQGFFSINKAQAVVPLPMGGYITYVNPLICNCPPGLISQIFVALPNPTVSPLVSNLLLSYTHGSQIFNWHNIPAPGIAVLGKYLPAVQACFTYVGKACVPVPNEGHLTGFVGSSLTPL